MITVGKKLHYLAIKKLSVLLRGIVSNYVGDFYCLNCFHSCSTKNKLKKHKDVCENHDYCYKEDLEIIKYNHGKKSMKVPFITYSNLRVFA